MTTVTAIFIVTTLLATIAYDVWALSKSQKTEYTISYVIGKVALKNPLIPFVFGVLMGHFFWAQCFIN